MNHMHLLMRADATTQMGTGHVMRSMALGQAWRDSGGSVEFFTRCESKGLVERLADEGFQVHRLGPESEWDRLGAVSRTGNGLALVVDGYHFDSAYQEHARALFRPLVVIDDLAHLTHYCADIVLNQNIYASQMNYSCASYTRLLLGCRWALLRREFRPWRNWKRSIPETGRKLLVTLGGSDPDNVTFRVVDAIAKCAPTYDLEIIVVAGANNPHVESLRTRVEAIPNARIEIGVNDMAVLMAWADLAVSAAGSTCWEMALMGLPSILIVLAENQHRIAQGLSAAGAAINLGWYKDLSIDSLLISLKSALESRSSRDRLSREARRLGDGNGAINAAAAIREALA